jgi:pimeloyl-ACP methyl ester carboxylesterase
MKYSKPLAAILLSGSLAVLLVAPRADAAEKPIALDTVMVTLPSGTVEYLDTGGKGVPLLLLHPLNIRLWQHQIPAFAKAGYRVIAIDSRNHATGAPPEGFGDSKGPMRIDELVVKLGLSKFHILGTDGNGALAFQYARAHPDKIRSLVMSGTFGGLRDPDLNALETSLRPAPFNDMPLALRYVSATYRAANPEGTKRWLELEQEGTAAVPQAPPPAGNPAGGAPPAGGGGPAAAGPRGGGAGGGDALTVAKLDAWQLPTMMITGDADLYTPPSMMRIFVSHLKHGEGAVIPESAHATYWENPEAYNRTVLKFIRKH